MTTDELIAEGRALQRSAALLKPTPTGPQVATWHDEATSQGHRWLTLNVSEFQTLRSLYGYVEVFSDRAVVIRTAPTNGIPLYLTPISILPPIDVVFRLGSEWVEEWLLERGWDRNTPYNDNFNDEAARRYVAAWMREHPMYNDDGQNYAIVGEWPFPFPDSDPSTQTGNLLLQTLEGAEPWIEVWQSDIGGLSVIERIT